MDKQINKSLRLEWIEAGTLAENPLNWRRHPEGQVKALKHVLGDPEIGWAGACLYNETTGRLIDGHARRNSVDPSTPIPVLIGSWSEQAEKKILLTLDPLASLATPSKEELENLIDMVALDGDLQAISDELLKQLERVVDAPNFLPAGEDEQGRLDQKSPTVCPKCGHSFTT